MSGVSENQTTWLTLVGFGKLKHLGFLPFALFLAIYVATVGGNILIVLAVASSRTLHTPMYFFLCHFSLLEIGYTSNIVPRLLQSFLEAPSSKIRWRKKALVLKRQDNRLKANS